MKIAVTADLHAHNYTQYSGVAESGLNSRLDWILRTLDMIVEKCVQRGVDAIVIAGDLFHSRKSIDITVLESVYKRIESIDFPVYIIKGNHDIAESINKRTSVRIFSKVAKVVTTARIVNIAGTRVGIVPWTDSAKAVSKIVDEFNKQGVHYVIGHLGMRSGTVGSHDYVMEGSIEPSVFRKFKWTALGHYHKHQKLKHNIYYVGSPLQHTWGDAGDEKGFMIFDGDKPEFIPLPSTPRFIKVMSNEDAKGVRVIDYVKITGKREVVESIELPLSVRKIEVVEKDDEYTPRLDFDETSIKSIVTTYCRAFPQDVVDEDFLIKVGVGYLRS